MIHCDYGCEINVVRHCTNACTNCNHGSTRYTEKYVMEYDVLKRDLDVMKNHLRTKLLFCQGGEPLLHPHLIEMMELCFQSGIAKQCGVLTNGKLLHRMGDAFFETLAIRGMELRISCYPDLSPDIVPFALEMGQKFGFFVRPQQIGAFKPLFRKNGGETYYGCPWNRCLTIHEGWFYLCPLTTFFPKQYMGLDEHIDGLPIEGITDEKLQTFLNKQTPLETCKICAGATGDSIPWHQNSSKEEWETEAGLKEALV